MYYSSSLKSNMAYVNDSDEEQEEEEDMLLACIEKKDPEKDPY